MLIWHHTDRPRATINYNLSTTSHHYIVKRFNYFSIRSHSNSVSRYCANFRNIVLTNQGVPTEQADPQNADLRLQWPAWRHNLPLHLLMPNAKEIRIIINLQIQLTIQLKLTFEELKTCGWLQLFQSWHSWLWPKGRFCIYIFKFLLILIFICKLML